MDKREKIKSYYDSNRKKARFDHEVLGWESREAHNMRFEILNREVPLHGMSILDVGCGLGNLLEYLIERNIQVEYHGVDILGHMIECARQKRLNGKFYCADIFKENPFNSGSFDVVYASGIFNLNLGNNREFLAMALKVFFSLANEYVVFNLLHYKSPDKEDKYFYYNPSEVRELLEQQFEAYDIKMVEQYLNNDFTVICRKSSCKTETKNNNIK